MNVREKIQNFESLTLIKEAAFSKNSIGRKIREEDDDICDEKIGNGCTPLIL